MNYKISIEKIDRLPLALSGCVLLMLVPVIIKSTILPSMNFTLLMASAFVLQIAWYYITIIGGIRIAISAATLVFLLNGMVTLILNLLCGRGIAAYDFINLAVKFLSLSLFFDIARGKGIRMRQLAKYAGCIMVFSIIACIYNLAVNWRIILSLFYSEQSPYAVSIKSFFLNRNQFGMFLVVAYVMTDYACAAKNSGLKWMIHLLQMVNTVFTLSRGSILALAVYVAAKRLLLPSRQKRRRSFMLLLLFGVLCLGLLLSVPGALDFINEKIFRTDAGATGRVDIWRMGLRVFSQNPINGIGTYTGLSIARAQGFQYEQFHSLFVDALVSGGIVELILTLYILLFIYKRCAGNLKNSKLYTIYRASFLALICMACFESVSFFSMGYVDSFFTINYITLPLLMSNMSNVQNDKLSAIKN